MVFFEKELFTKYNSFELNEEFAMHGQMSRNCTQKIEGDRKKAGVHTLKRVGVYMHVFIFVQSPVVCFI